MKRRAPIPLLLAAALLALAGLLLSFSEPARPARAQAEVSFPRWLREEETARVQARRTLPPLPAPAPEATVEPPERRDPFLVALPRAPEAPLLVLEANALRHSRLGELFVECVMQLNRGRDPFEETHRELGIDPLKDVDRVAFTPEGVLVFGFLDRARLGQLAAESVVTARGADGRIFTPREPGPSPMTVGTWRGQLIALGEPHFVEATFDRLEGRDPETPPVLTEELTYGEAYGVVPGAALRSLFGAGQEELGRRLAEAASRIELHADAMRDVAIVARVSGTDEKAVADLGTMLGAALAVGRIEALAKGDQGLGELLEHARVERGQGGGFSLELALPIEVLERWFRGCHAPP